MIKGTRNQHGNAKNPYQGSALKVLTVCSAGLLRSATLQNFLIKEYDYNVRNCGTVESFALIPISDTLIYWADLIVFVNKENYNEVKSHLSGKKVVVLDIPDKYSFNDPELVNIIRNQWELMFKEINKVGNENELYFEYDITKLKIDDNNT